MLVNPFRKNVSVVKVYIIHTAAANVLTFAEIRLFLFDWRPSVDCVALADYHALQRSPALLAAGARPLLS